MTTSAPERSGSAARSGLPTQRSGSEGHGAAGRVEEPARVFVASTALRIFACVLLAFVVHLVVLGSFSYSRAQRVGYAELRNELAQGTASVGRTTAFGKPLPVGTPIAILEIPRLKVRQVVFEGTTSGVLREGPGHRRDSVLPGQPSNSVLLGRRSTYGGPFGDIASLRSGDPLTVTTGQGPQQFVVLGVRHAGDLAPPALQAGEGRLTLMTTDGSAFAPSGVLRVDAQLVSPAQAGPNPPFGAATLPKSERLMQGEPGAWFPVFLWCQALLLVSLGIVWFRARWGVWQTWLVGIPTVLATSVALAGAIARLLPNLL